MAASAVAVEESEVVTALSHSLGISKEILANVASYNEDSASVLGRVKAVFDERASSEEKYRLDMANLRRARVNAEQQFSQIEKQLISCNSKLESEQKQHTRLQKEHAETVVNLAEKQKRLQEVESIKEDAAANYSRVSKLNEQLESEKLDLLSVVERKNQEIDRLNDEWKLMSNKLSEANSVKCEAQAKLDEIESQETSLKFREKRIEQEKELVQKQNTWLSDELKTKTDELGKLRKEKSSQVLELQTQLDETIEELSQLKTSAEALRESNTDMKTKVESYMDKLKEAREQFAKMEDHFKTELTSQSKLATLYKDSADEAKKKSDELLTAFEELQKLLKEANEGRLDSDSKLKEQENFQAEKTKEYEDKISKLERELENANDLLAAARQRGAAPLTPAELSTLSPTAAATSSFMKSGMTLTQIYSQYVEVSDALQQEKDENIRLKQYLDQILKEIEEKAPILQQQRRDYEQALHSVDQLSRRLDSALMENEESKGHADEAVRKSEHLKRENDRLRTLSADLSQQVQVLLKECEEARGGVVSSVESMQPMSSAEVTSSSQVISEHLVTFRSIEEMQQQNQKLLGVVRELSEEKEKREGENAIDSLQKQLDDSFKEVEGLKEARERQMKMVEAVVRQRDMYRVLLAASGQTPIPISDEDSPLTSSPLLQRSDKTATELEETKLALKELQRHFETYKTERAQVEGKLSEKQEKLESQNIELNGTNARLSSQLEFIEERYSMLKTNSEAFRKEASAASEKSRNLQVANSKIQATLDSISQELTSMKEKCNKLEVDCENLKAEKALMKESEVRLMQENKSLLEHQKSQNALVTNLQTLQNNLERSEFEARTRLGSQVDTLQRELNLLKKKLESEEKHHKGIISTWENRVQELQSQLNVEIKTHQQARDQLLTSTRDIDSVQLRCTQAEAQLQAAEKRIDDILNSEPGILKEGDQERIRKEVTEQYTVRIEEFELKLNDAEAKIRGLEEQLQHAKKHADQFKSMSEANETALSDLNKTSEEFRRSTETKLNEAEQEISQYKTKVSTLQALNQDLNATRAKLTRETESQTRSLRDMLSKVRAELDEALKKAQTSTAAEMTAKEELKEQAVLAKEAQDKYERELLLHANDVQALTTIKAEFQEQSSKFQEIEDRAVAAEQKLQQHLSSWDEQNKAKASETKKLEARCADLVNQNSTLHSQLEKMSAQLAASKESTVNLAQPPKEVMTTDGSSEGNKTVDELWEIIRFVRREKEISETKCELSQSESIRYQQRCEYLEGQLQELQKNVTDQRTQSEVDSQTAAQHAEIMEKVQKLNELTEANKLLTSEKESADETVRELVTKIQVLEADVRPLKDNIQSLTTQKDALLAEKTALKNEIVRWTAKTNQLSEQFRNVDVDEYKRMKEEKKQFQQQVSSLKTDNQRMRTQTDSLKSELSKTQGELVGLKAVSQKSADQVSSLKEEHQKAISKLQEEVETLKSSVTAKTEEVNEKNKTLLQVKRIARRYKTQVDEQTKEMEDLKKKVNESEQQEGAGKAVGTAASSAGNVDVAEYENKIKELTEQVNNSEEEVKRLKELDEQNKISLKEKEDKNKKVLIQAREKLQQLTATKDRLTSENEELKKKNQSYNDEKEGLNQQLAEQEMRLKVLNSQFEGKVTRLEKELQASKEDREKTERAAEDAKKKSEETKQRQEIDMEKLQQKLQQYQSLIQKQQLKIKALTAAAAAASNASSRSSPSELSGAETSSTQEVPSVSVTSTPPVYLVPPTATIKPTTTPTPIKRAGPKASIRPIAVAPTQSTPTPTATVLPTVTSTPSEAVSVAGFIRGTGTALTTASSVSTSVPTTVSVRPITSTEEELRQPPEGEPEVSSTEVTVFEPSQPTPSTAVVSGKRQRDEPQVADRSTTEVAEGISIEEEPVTKRIRTAEVQVEGEVGTSQEAVVEESTTGEEAAYYQFEEGEAVEEVADFLDVEEGDEDEGGEEEDEEEQREGAVDTGDERTAEAEAVAPEVVLIESDDDEVEEGDYDEDEDEEYAEEAEDDELDEEGEGEGEGEYMEDEDEEDEGEDMEEEEEEEEEERDDGKEDLDDKQDIVEVIDDDDVDVGEEEVVGEDVEESQGMQDEPLVEETEGDVEEEAVAERMEQRQSELEQAPTRAAVEREIPTTAQQVSVQESEAQVLVGENRRTPPITAQQPQRRLSIRSHLAPFSFPQGQPAPGPFNDEEDCMVPSTPTLFVPKRTDGFAEAISSPQINPASFSFGAPGESSMSPAGVLQLGLSEEGLRVDDTQVDLMGGSDEASNERPSFVVPTGLPEASDTSSQPANQRLPSSSSDTRQLSLESLESEPEGGNIATVPAITVTEASEESNEQNVPVSQAHPESLETEVVELLDDAEALKEDEAGDHEAEAKERRDEATFESRDSAREDESRPSTSGVSSDAGVHSSAGSTAMGTSTATKTRQDPNRTKGSVVQLKRPGTSATWSGTRGGQQAQRGAPSSGRVRRLRRDPVAGPSHRGRGSHVSRGRGGGTPRGGQS